MRCVDVFCDTQYQHHIISVSPMHAQMFYGQEAQPEEAILVDSKFCKKCRKWESGECVHFDSIVGLRDMHDVRKLKIYRCVLNATVKIEGNKPLFVAPLKYGSRFISIPDGVEIDIRTQQVICRDETQVLHGTLRKEFVKQISTIEEDFMTVVTQIIHFKPQFPLTIHNVLCTTNENRVLARTFKARYVSLDLVQPDEIVLTCVIDETHERRVAKALPENLLPQGKHNYGVLVNENVIYMTLRPDFLKLGNVYAHWKCFKPCKDCNRHTYRSVVWIT